MTKRPGDLGGKGQKAQLRRVYIEYLGICQVCFEYCPLEEASRDHVIPLRKGGSKEDTNVVLAHKDCNSFRDWISKAINGTIKRQAIGLSPYAERKNPGRFAPFSYIKDKP